MANGNFLTSQRSSTAAIGFGVYIYIYMNVFVYV